MKDVAGRLNLVVFAIVAIFCCKSAVSGAASVESGILASLGTIVIILLPYLVVSAVLRWAFTGRFALLTFKF